jgi:predicted ATPase
MPIHSQITIDRSLIGRQTIIEELLHHLRDGKSAFLVGEEGIGKTAILQEVIAAARAEQGRYWPLYCSSVRNEKECLEWVAASFHAEYGDSIIVEAMDARKIRLPAGKGMAFWRRVPRRLLRRIVIPRLRSGRYALVLDHLVPLRSDAHAFFEWLLMEFKVPLIAAVRGVQPKDIGRLWWLDWAFTVVEVPALRLEQVRALIERELRRHRAELPDRAEFARNLAQASRGNPRIITRVCERAGDHRYRMGDQTNLRLLMLDLKIDDLGKSEASGAGFHGS